MTTPFSKINCVHPEFPDGHYLIGGEFAKDNSLKNTFAELTYRFFLFLTKIDTAWIVNFLGLTSDCPGKLWAG
jgi:hypothetical protein